MKFFLEYYENRATLKPTRRLWIMPRRLTKNDKGVFEAKNKTDHQAWTFDEGFDRFIKRCKVRNLSPQSIALYERHYRYFIDWYKETNPKFKWCGSINNHDIDNYIAYLVDKGLADKTIKTMVGSLQSWMSFLFENKACQEFKFPKRKIDEKQVRSYTDEELAKLLRAPEGNEIRFSEYRNWVIVNTLVNTGVRIGNLVAIRISDIDFNKRKLTLAKTKTRKSYDIPLNSELCKILQDYLYFREAQSNDDFLFCTESGKPMDTTSAKQMIKNYNRSRGVQATSCHMFRHTFARICVLNHIDAYRLMHLLGHSTMDMTKRYIDLYSEDLLEDIDNFTLGGSKNLEEKKKKPRRSVTL